MLGGVHEGRPASGDDDRSIRLVLPADHEWGRVARTAVAGLALRLGFSYREIEDLRLAIDETLILLLRPAGTTTSADDTVEVSFVPTDDGLEIDASTTLTDPGGSNGTTGAARERFEGLVTPTVDAWTVTEDARHVHLRKHHHR